MKLYAKKATATAIAKKMSNDDQAYAVVEQDGQWAVVPEGQQIGDQTEVAEAQVEVETEAEDQVEADFVTVEFKGARLTPMYVITPPISGKGGAVDRWFERSRCKAVEATLSGVRVTLPRKALEARGIDPSEFEVKEAA